MDDMILTNVRLAPAEHQAAKRRAVDLGIPLSELLRRGLQLALADSGPAAGQVQECHVTYAPERMSREERLRVLAETAGAVKSYDDWEQELRDLRAASWRDVWGDDKHPGGKP